MGVAATSTIGFPSGLPMALQLDQQHRHFGKARAYRNRKTSKKQKQKEHQRKLPPPQVLPRRATDPILKSKYTNPDHKKEKFLAELQNKVQEAYREGNYRKGEKAAKELLKACEEHYKEDGDHPAIASAHNDLGLFGKLNGDFDQARLSYQKALNIYKKTVGSDHSSVSSILHNMGILNRTQIHLDTTLKATDRLTLLEEALSVTREAYYIRLDERGPEHPHTVASKSSLGATLAMGILQHFKAASNKQSAAYQFLATKNITEEEWGAAEQNLREALQTAIDSPRGLGLQSSEYLEKVKEEKRESIAPQLSTKIQTLSASAAAQNLAIFLKARATTVEIVPELSSKKSKSSGQTETEEKDYNKESPGQALSAQEQRDALFQEAHVLYQNVLALRRELLHKKHPDVYTTIHSLAELLHAMGDEEGANALRREIVDMYDPPKKENKGSVEVTKTTGS